MLSHKLLMMPRASQANDERLLPASRPLPAYSTQRPRQRGDAQRKPKRGSELRSDWQAEAYPTKAVRAALGWTRQSLIPQHSDEESMSFGEEICCRRG
jgi:hypothetical protein